MKEKTTFKCALCGEEHSMLECYTFDGKELCRSCYESKTTTCEVCGERIWLDDAETDGYTTLCHSCYDEYYTYCENCGRLVHISDAYYPDGGDDAYCCRCANNLRSSRQAIKCYSYKPRPLFYGDDSERFFGVELEMDEGGESNSNATTIMNIANEESENVYCKHDGSLDDGFEIVTHPMTLRYHINSMPWKEILEKAVELGYRSHQAGTCGLHVHVNRDTFGVTEEEQEAAIARVLFFVENHWNELLKFSRRTRSQMEHWAARYGRKDNPKEQIEHAKSNFSDRYRAVNLTNQNTIEFRMFRGSLRRNTLVATLQLVNEICELAGFLSDEEMANLTWTDFCARIGNLSYPELVEYLKIRRLYVCEPVTAEEEI